MHCDDGNTADGDGCSATCQVELGWTCEESRSDPNVPYVCYGCKDGIKSGHEECDDGNLNNGDGCSSQCLVESGYSCTTASPSVCGRCGDGVTQTDIGEECDDQNADDTDGCTSACKLLPGYKCTGTTCTVSCGATPYEVDTSE